MCRPRCSLAQESIEEYAKQSAGGITRIAIAHRLSTIKAADLIAFVQNGTVAEWGTYDVGASLLVLALTLLQELVAKQGKFFTVA